MLNFRKLKQDFSTNILKEGKDLFDKEHVLSAKIVHMDGDTIRLSTRVKGAFDNVYESEIEIDRCESCAIDSTCDCTYTYDCQHLAAFLYFLEKNLHSIVVNYSQEADLDTIDEEEKEQLVATFEEAQAKEGALKDKQLQKEILREYIFSATLLGSSPFFLPPKKLVEDQAELGLVFQVPKGEALGPQAPRDMQIALRLPNRSKPLLVPNVKAFFSAIRYKEPIHILGKTYFFSLSSFESIGAEIVRLLFEKAQYPKGDEEKLLRTFSLAHEEVGDLVARVFELALQGNRGQSQRECFPLPHLFVGSLEEPLMASAVAAQIECRLEYLETPHPNLLIVPTLVTEEEEVSPEEALLFASAKPGIIHQNIYYRFGPKVTRVHLKELKALQEMTIPEPLFGAFIENGLPTMRSFVNLRNPHLIERFSTLPYVEELKGRCEIHYLDGELEAKLYFIYDDKELPAASSKLNYDHLTPFVKEEGITARNLVEERAITLELFQDFLFDEREGTFKVKSEKKIVEFMTEILPRYQDKISFECPENLSEQFIYDTSTFELSLNVSERIDTYTVDLKVLGDLDGVHLDVLWECLASKKRFVELSQNKKEKGKIPRILVLDLEKIAPIVQLLDEIGLEKMATQKQERPLWSLTTLCAEECQKLPIKFSMSSKLKEIQKQILGEITVEEPSIPKEIQAKPRNYQVEGIAWLAKLRKMHLGGILADDMGLGKTLQAIVAISQALKLPGARPALIVCPTSLVYNWKEEFHKFNPTKRVLVVDNGPAFRRKLLKTIDEYDIVVTSYNLLQKDIQHYQELQFGYVVLDEAQHIKNRGTRNAKSVKMIQAKHRLILTGTPIENSLDELWSLFDFLMPGLLSTYDRFLEKFIRPAKQKDEKRHLALEALKRKVSPFILRRMKEDVLDDLPPVSENIYYCHLTQTQQDLYRSYAASAKEELSKLVKKEGFDKIQIHVLATLTRLKQICCHPAIFAKEQPESGDCAKYELLMELLNTLMEGGHKCVLFSQYTKMLGIIKEDLERRGIRFSYLDGSSKNRLEIVNEFNEDSSIPLFLVSLKAGGAGLNLVGADTVIHYDMWWNPAVESQATDRVHRLGQKKSVSSFKLVTLNTIEEKILNLQKRKKGLVKKVISSDEEAISKLTWEEVLELLQT